MLGEGGSYFDPNGRGIAQVSVGTNGGAVYTRPDNVPERSISSSSAARAMAKAAKRLPPSTLSEIEPPSPIWWECGAPIRQELRLPELQLDKERIIVLDGDLEPQENFPVYGELTIDRPERRIDSHEFKLSSHKKRGSTRRALITSQNPGIDPTKFDLKARNSLNRGSGSAINDTKEGGEFPLDPTQS